MQVTASILYNLTTCPQRVALDSFGDASEKDAISPFVQLLWERGSAFENGNHRRTQRAISRPVAFAG